MKNRFLQHIIDKLRGKPIALEKSHYGYKHIYKGYDAQDLIFNELTEDKPTMICRFGGTELSIVNYYLRHKKDNFIKYTQRLKNKIEFLSGFFPATDYNLSRFSYEFLELVKNIDIIGVWFNSGEEKILEEYGKNAKLVHLVDISPVENGCSFDIKAKPYTKALEGKKVLVIHPFSETIKNQYQKREFLFNNSDTLPKFELITIKAVQSLHDNVEGLSYKSWFEALDYMKHQISQIDFDIAIIGCGAYGIFLADYIKSIGKKAIHMGGATQLLFGIIGQRWEEALKSKINEYWVRPSKADKPKGAEKVEGGCYW